MLSLNGRGRTARGPLFATAKSAIARVSDTVRESACDGPITLVELQAAVASAEWETIESWGQDVVERICRQSFTRGGAVERRPAESDARVPPHEEPPAPVAERPTMLEGLADAPADDPRIVFELPDCDAPHTVSPAEPAVAPSDTPRQPKRQRWHVAGTAGLLIIVWAGLLYWMTGGDLGVLWEGPAATAAVADDIGWARERAPGLLPHAPAPRAPSE